MNLAPSISFNEMLIFRVGNSHFAKGVPESNGHGVYEIRIFVAKMLGWKHAMHKTEVTNLKEFSFRIGG